MRKFLLILFAFVLMAGLTVPAMAQEEPPVRLQARVGAGVGSFFGEEDTTFSSDALFANLHWYGVALPVDGGSSGVGLEVHFGNNVSYALWNLNRADVPGMVGKAYGVADMKFGEGSNGEGAGYRADFDFRAGLGMYLGKVGNGNLVLEFYTLEENRPIAFSVMYRF